MSKFKRKAIALFEKHNIDYCADSQASWETCWMTGKKQKVHYIDIDAPEGYRFEPELHCLVCDGWEDAYVRVLGYLRDDYGLEKCDSDCGDHYECWKSGKHLHDEGHCIKNAETFEDCEVCYATVDRGTLNDVQAGRICNECHKLNQYDAETFAR